MNGALLIDKPAGPTSHDIVNRVRRLAGERRVGHIGTLDPFATGLLVLLLGKATRLARFFDTAWKSYDAVMRIGLATTTFDLTGEPLGPDRGEEFDAAALTRILDEFQGEMLQQPPSYSAKKVSGVAAYKRARKGQAVELAPVAVTLSDLRLLSIERQRVEFSVRVSSGTYIRSLAHDIGQRLGIGAHLTALRRTAVSDFTLRDAATLDRLEANRGGMMDLGRSFISVEGLLPNLPRAVLSPTELTSVLHGNSVSLQAAGEWVKLFSEAGHLVALAKAEGGGRYHPNIVLCDTAGAGHRQ